jgi:hypothetical protein
LKEKNRSLENKVNELKQIVKSSEAFTPRRLKIIYSNTEYRFKDIFGLNNKYIPELQEITLDCIKILDNTGAKDSFDTYNLKLEGFLNNILTESLITQTLV